MENGHVISMIRGYFIEKKRKNDFLYSYIYDAIPLSFFFIVLVYALKINR